MNLPDLKQWETTRDCLHRVAQVIGELRRLHIPSQPNALHLAVYIAPEGVTTGALPDGSDYTFDYGSAEIVYTAPNGDATRLSLEGQTPKSLLESALKLSGSFTTELLSNSRISDDKSLQMDDDVAEGYANLQYMVFQATATFRARLYGTMTPLVIWPHHFDISFLWFAGHNPDEHTEPHMNFGFSPHSEGFDDPYLYFYVYPMPEGAMDEQPPAPARWNTDGFTGIVLDYADINASDNPSALIESTFRDIHAMLAPLL